MKAIDADALKEYFVDLSTEKDIGFGDASRMITVNINHIIKVIENAPSIDIVRCGECRKSHIDGKTTHYLWCTEWGRSTDTFGYCERGEREGE